MESLPRSARVVIDGSTLPMHSQERKKAGPPSARIDRDHEEDGYQAAVNSKQQRRRRIRIQGGPQAAKTMVQPQRQGRSPFPSSLLLVVLLAVLLLSKHGSKAIEIKWTPADGEGPAPASKRYRDAMAAQQQQQQGGGGGRGISEEEQMQRLMQQMQMQQQQGQRPPPSFVERLVLAGYMAIGGAVGMAQRHPKAAATLSLTAVTGLCLQRAARTNGLLLTRRPGYLTAFEPPVEFLARLLEEELPPLVEKEWAGEGDGGGSSSPSRTAFKGTLGSNSQLEGEEDGVVSRRVQVGDGEAAFRKAATLLRTLSLMDAVATGDGPSLGRLYSSERMQEALFVRRRPGGKGWSLAPVAVKHRGGRLASLLADEGGAKKGKKGKAKKKTKNKKVEVEEVYEETVLRALPGCAWGRGAELRLSASWRDPATGGDDAVMVEAAWYAPKGSGEGTRAPYLERVARKAREMVEQEMAVLRVRERQQRQLAEDALKAEAERKRKERQAILNPPPDKKKWRKQQQGLAGGQQGPARWQPSSDLQARRNPRRGG